MSLTERPSKSLSVGLYKWAEGATTPPRPEPPKVKLVKGMRIKIDGTLFKVIAARENGKVTIKPE